MSDNGLFFKIYCSNWRSWAWIGISTKYCELISSKRKSKCAFNTPWQCKINNFPLILSLVQSLYLLRPFKSASVSSNHIQIPPPLNCKACAPFDIQIRQHDPLIFGKWVFLAIVKYGFLIFSEIPSSNDIHMLIIKNRGVCISWLVHIYDFLGCMRQAIIDERLWGNICQRVTDSSWYKEWFVGQWDHTAKVIWPKAFRYSEPIYGFVY